jgi:hypothetical protein
VVLGGVLAFMGVWQAAGGSWKLLIGIFDDDDDNDDEAHHQQLATHYKSLDRQHVR